MSTSVLFEFSIKDHDVNDVCYLVFMNEKDVAHYIVVQATIEDGRWEIHNHGLSSYEVLYFIGMTAKCSIISYPKHLPHHVQLLVEDFVEDGIPEE